MKKLLFISSLFLVCTSVFSQGIPRIPDGFVYVKDIIPDIQLDVRYYSDNNFVGARVDGYYAPKCILTKEAADSLAKVQAELRPFGLGLKIFDAYRPQEAVNHFVRWAENMSDTATKHLYYPRVLKANLFKEGYIASKSGHSRGSTVDLTIVSLKEEERKRELYMGTRFDFFGPESWPIYGEISMTSRAHRMLLRLVMEKNGFKPLHTEWWHFTLRDEPYPGHYFNFPVK